MPNTLPGFELWASLATATVTSGGNDAPSAGSSESWTLSGSSLPSGISNTSTPNQGIYCQDVALPNSEVFSIVNVSGSTATVIRGADGTTPVVHTNPFVIRPVITGATLRALNPTSGLPLGQYTAAASVATSGTITPGTTTEGTGWSPYVPVTCAASVTGVILSAGNQDGQLAVLNNQGSFAITFAASGTSRVADGTSDVLTPGQTVAYIWNAQTSLWYRAAPPTEQYVALSTTYTLTSTTSAQQLFNATSAGAITVPASTLHWWECEFDLSSLSSTSGTFSFGFGGTATLTQVKYWASAQKSAAAGTLATWSSFVVATGSATALVAASTTTTGAAILKGFLITSAAGTLIPQVTLSVASAGVVGAGSWFRIRPAAPGTALAALGNWS